MPDLLKVTERLATQLKNAATEDDRILFSSFFQDACRRAGVREMDRLAAVYARVPPELYEKELLLKYIAAAWIGRELAAIHAENASVSLPEVAPSLPPALEKAPKELVNAYSLFKRAIQPYEKAFPSDDSTDFISFQKNQKSFFGLIEKVLNGREKGLADKLYSYDLAAPRSIAIFMTLLRERRLTEAVGAALLIVPRHGDLGTRDLLLRLDGKCGLRVEFLKLCGLDWETVLAGAALDSENRDSPSGWRWPSLYELAAFGSDRAALLVEQMARRAKPQERELYARVIGAFLDQGGAKTRETFSSDDAERVAPPISAGARRKLLEALEKFATADSPNRLATTILSSLERAHDRGTIPALRSLLVHPSPTVATEATRLLRDFGEDVAVSIKADPVRFKILIDGEPLPAGLDVSWGVQGESGGGVSSIAEVGEGGILGIERSKFLDPERKPAEVFLERYESLGRPWFGISVPVTADLDTVRPVNVETASIKLILRNIRHGMNEGNRKARIEIRRAEEERRGLLGHSPAEFAFPADEPILIDGLQVGKYELTVLVPGHERWQQSVVAERESQPIDVSLQPGSDVHAKIVLSGKSEEPIYSELLHNGKELQGFYPDETDTYRGLPMGSYVLHIRSSKEARYFDTAGDHVGPDEIDYAARDVAFVISENSPALIDLGTIHLEQP